LRNIFKTGKESKLKEVNLTVNGVKQKVAADPDLLLLDFLRLNLRLTGTKQSCERKGQCGACTVIINGKAERSCLKKVKDLDGANVITIEGLGTPENPHLIQEAFVLAGAVQCGFCTPGMIMATKGLLDQNPNPSVPEIKQALSRNLCRCTGYKKIVDAVQLAGSFIRKETTPAKVKNKIKKGMIGVSHPRPTAMPKACGKVQFSADLMLENMAHLACHHSTEHHAIIKSIDTSEAESMPGVIGVMTADDIKGTNRIRFLAADQPVLMEDKVRVFGDIIVAVAAETRAQARAAAAKVKVVYEPLPVMLTPEEALAPDAMQIHQHSPNLCFAQPLVKGDAAKALASSAAVIEAEFKTQMNEQSPLEPETCVAHIEGKGKNAELIVHGRSVLIHDTAAQVAEAVGFDKVRYIESFSGGQFGRKVSTGSEAVTAAATMHFKRPISYVPSVWESMMISTKRHPYDMKVKLGADSKGHITGYDLDFTLNKGAYFCSGFIPILRSLVMISSAYNIPHIHSFGKLVYTNNGYGGAARGAGPPQSTFALESAIDMLAEKLNMDPLEFRKMNSLKSGQVQATGPAVTQWPFPELCDKMRPHFDRARKDAEAFNKKGGPIKRGVGIAAESFGIGVSADRADVTVEVNPDDGITIYAAIADPGEGNDSMLTQIAAHVLEIPMDKIRLHIRDTDKTVPMGPAASSRITYMGGGAVLDALEKIKKAYAVAGGKTHAALKKAGQSTKFEGTKQIPGPPMPDPETGQGVYYESAVHNIQMVEIEVNTETGEAKVIKITSAVDAGTVIHPQNLEGQLEGGQDQGVGYALREEYISGKTKDWVTFKYPTMKTSFDMEAIIQETPRVNGPLGATGVGEMTMVSTAPAVTNAIYNACGARICNLPATPEKIKAALQKAK
jgi:aldehyde oxidoreductase